MIFKVITILDNQASVRVAERCMWSGDRHGHNVEMHPAITPKDDPLSICEKEGIDPLGFEEKYSRNLNCISAFLSHYSLWKECVERDDTMLILEHDAYITEPIRYMPFEHICNYGKPSYGRFNTPPLLGMNKLTSKRYLPGAHAYGVTPNGANLLIEQARISAKPTDVFINLDTFDNINEYYPWPVDARDSFTTIQNTTGCLAKHSYDEGYKIINAND